MPSWSERIAGKLPDEGTVRIKSAIFGLTLDKTITTHPYKKLMGCKVTSKPDGSFEFGDLDDLPSFRIGRKDGCGKSGTLGGELKLGFSVSGHDAEVVLKGKVDVLCKKGENRRLALRSDDSYMHGPIKATFFIEPTCA